MFASLLVPSGATALVGPSDTGQWPSFRGSNASGVATGFATPTKWNVETGEGVKWKTPIPGLGYGAPVIWGDRLFVTAAVGTGDPLVKVGLYGSVQSVKEDAEQEYVLYCLDKKTGEVRWQRTVHKAVPKIKRHPKASHANCTPATDGKHVVTFFGSEGLYCHTVDGELLWKKDLGLLDSGWYVDTTAQWGFGSSPIIHDGMVIVQCDVQEDSFLAAFDVKTGKEIWRTPRDEVPTWSTPTIYEAGGTKRLAVNGYKHIGGYDLATGKEVWKLRGGGDIPVPTPIVGEGLIFITNAHGMMAPIYAIRIEAEGDISLDTGQTRNSHIPWSRPKRGNYMQTPLLVDGLLHCCSDRGILTVYDAKEGTSIYRKRIGDGRTGFTASPVAAGGKIYFTSEVGDVHVFQIGREYKPLAVNPLGEICMATPAISQGVLFFHTQRHVVAVGE